MAPLVLPQKMPLMEGTLRATSLHLMNPSLPLLSFALSTKRFSSLSSAPVNPTPKPLYLKSPNPTPPFALPKHKLLPNSAVSSQSQSIEHPPSNPTEPQPNQTEPPKEHKEYLESPTGLLQRKLNHCLKRGHVVRALELYDSAVAAGTPLSVRHYNCLLYLCSLPSSSSSIADVTSEVAGVSNGEGDGGSDVCLDDAEAKFNDPEIRKMAIDWGFEIYKRMCHDPDVEPNEATFTSLTRLKTQRQSIKHLPSNPTKPRLNQTKPPDKHSKNPKLSAGAVGKREAFVLMKKKRKEYRESPAGSLQRDLDRCSKRGNTVRALELYDSAVAAGTPLSMRHYNCLLYLCSLPSCSSSIADVTSDVSSDVTFTDAETKFKDPEISKMAVERGFEIYRRMCEDPDVEPNEATFTSLARLAAIKGDPRMAFDLVKQTVKSGMLPKLRSYGPALHGFCDALDVEMAHEVETHMAAHGALFLFFSFCVHTDWNPLWRNWVIN